MRHPPARRGFTLIELLVVVAIIALLIAILLPSLGRAREHAKNTTCKANLKGNATAMFNYTYDNAGKFPSESTAVGGGLILWDITISMTDQQLKGVGNIRKSYYCPMYPQQNQDNLWAYNATYRVVGYFYFNKRKNTTLEWLDSASNTSRKRSKSKMTFMGSMEDGELITDVTLSKPGTPLQFSNIELGGGGGFGTNHVKGSKPAGTNVAFIDGHVDWRPFGEMKGRYISQKGPPDDFTEWF